MKIIRMSLCLFLLTGSLVSAQTPRIGPSFSDELKVAGLMGLPFSWRESDGVFNLSAPRLTNLQRTAIQGVIDSHDPTKHSEEKKKTDRRVTDRKKLGDICAQVEGSASASADLKSLCQALLGLL